MTFLYPAMLSWAAICLGVGLLYLFRRRPRTQQVSTLIFFKMLAKEHQESAWMRRLKRLLSLLLALAFVLALGLVDVGVPVRRSRSSIAPVVAGGLASQHVHVLVPHLVDEVLDP